ncbi:ATP-binding protein [Candidatus Woesearchaeota archaeon]|nr:ATP-binding protein [Candidatus Woesearchaeota archaeon]
MKGTIIGGSHNKILIRQKYGQNVEIGELLVSQEKDKQEKTLLQVYDLIYGSQLSQANLELISGIKLEQGSEEHPLSFIEHELRNYNLVIAKNLIQLDTNTISKSLPCFFSDVRGLKEEDLKFITKPKNPLHVGRLRSGSKIFEHDIYLQGDAVLSEHILISASTGKGKSNLTKCILWSLVEQDFCGVLVLDPHDEYYGRNKHGLKDHPIKNKIIYYSKNPPAGARSLKININLIKPSHFNGVVNWTDAQYEALVAYYNYYSHDWINAILLERTETSAESEAHQNFGAKQASGPRSNFHEATIGVIKRRLLSILDLKLSANSMGLEHSIIDDRIMCKGIFDFHSGESTVHDIAEELENARTVIIDTSNVSSQQEIFIGSLICNELFNKYKQYKTEGILPDKPLISVVIEEAPRVLGKDVLEKGSNIFDTIAREGRKFKVGLIAITQLPSLIPRQILANMNTKIILGMEMGIERKAIIESASQDLNDDDKNIACLDKGEAIITSNFVRFATPIKIPLFEELISKEIQTKFKQYAKDFSGVNLG